MNQVEAFALINQIREHLKLGGYPRPDLIDEIRKILFELKYQGFPLGEKPGSLLTWVEILFSTRKFDRFGGVDRVRSHALADCVSMETLISAYFQHRDQS